MSETKALRDHLARVLSWREAHATFDDAVADFPPERRGERPADLPYSAWQLVEHIRRTQRDILDFCREERYEERHWPDDYWPPDAAPPTPAAWDECVEAVRADRDALAALAGDESRPLLGTVPAPRGTGQTYLREILLAADHMAYHVGELIVLRRLLKAWG